MKNVIFMIMVLGSVVFGANEVYCELPNGILDRYAKVARLIKATENSYECRNCGSKTYSWVISSIISPNNKIDLSTTKPIKFRIVNSSGIYADKRSFNEHYNDEDYRKYTTCDERLAAYNEALEWFKANHPNGRSLDSYIDRQVKRNDPAKALEAESDVLQKMIDLLDEKVKENRKR